MNSPVSVPTSFHVHSTFCHLTAITNLIETVLTAASSYFRYFDAATRIVSFLSPICAQSKRSGTIWAAAIDSRLLDTPQSETSNT